MKAAVQVGDPAVLGGTDPATHRIAGNDLDGIACTFSGTPRARLNGRWAVVERSPIDA